ncbi:MAG TPA: hypothetical protein ENK59_05555 [Thioploca sp.]|nr:hypothetical protein [Thioploca sp.]
MFTFNRYHIGQLLDLVIIQNIENKTFSSSKENYLIDKESTIEKTELNNFHRVRFVSIHDDTELEEYDSNEASKTKYFLARVDNPISQVSYQKLLEPELIFKNVQTSSRNIALKLEQCEQYFNANHLTTGKQGTALDCYQQMLILNPTNILAKKGLNKIEQRYQQWAETAINKGNLKKAHDYIKRLQKVNRKSIALPKLRRLLASSKTLPTKNTQRKLQSSNKKVVKKSSHSTKKISKRCNDIFFQESLGIRALTSEQKRIKQQYCK